MELKLVNRLAMLGVAFIGIGNMLYSTDQEAYKIQEQVIMDMSDIIELESEIDDRKKRNEKELYFKNYKIVLKD